jgi:hypothetical protein
MGQGDFEAEIPLDNYYPKTSSLSFRIPMTNNSQFNVRNFTARQHATKHLNNREN